MIAKTLNTNRERLKNLIQEKAFLRRGPHEKPFVLASGATSREFFNCKNVTQDPEGISLIAEIVFDMIKDLNVDAIGGVPFGAIPISTAVAQISIRKQKPIPAFWVREKRKGHGTMSIIEGGLEAGSRVVIVDDVTTTGKSILKNIKPVQDLGCEIVEVITMVDREAGAEKRFKEAGYKFVPIFCMSEFKNQV